MSTSAIERRIAPRFGLDYHAELACGDALLPVQVWDVSMTGCGLKVMNGALSSAHPLSTKGLLIFDLQGDNVSTMLPVRLINTRIEARTFCYGVGFRVLSQRQKRNLIRLIEENTLQIRWRRAS